MNVKILAIVLFFYCMPLVYSDIQKATYDMAEIKDPSTLEIKIVQDWQVDPNDKKFKRKLVEITICEWWPGQKVRLPVTYIVPNDKRLCKNILVSNMGLALKVAKPDDTMLKLVNELGVGLVLVGMSTIDAMEPVGQLHFGMKEWLLKTKNPRYSPAWIWGMSDMRGLTAALTEESTFKLDKVLVTGGSKRGIAAAICGIHDDRFTATMPVVAPPMGIPGGSYVMGLDDPKIVQSNELFMQQLKNGELEELPKSAYKALEDRKVRRDTQRILLERFEKSGWSEIEIADLSSKVWEISRMTEHLEKVERKNCDFLYIVGTNDSVTPSLVELGRKYPKFPIFIVAGGQHGGPNGAGYTKQVPKVKEVKDNLYAFASHHFSKSKGFPIVPSVNYKWNNVSKVMEVTIDYDGLEPISSSVSWSEDRHRAYELELEYDEWETQRIIKKESLQKVTFEVKPKRNAKSLDLLTSHTFKLGSGNLSLSSSLVKIELDH